MGSFAKYLPAIAGVVGAPFTGGSSLALTAALLGAGGSALAAFGQGGKQGNAKQQSTQSTSQNIDTTTTPIEDPEFAAFRKMLLPLLGKELGRANDPVYGDAQKAGFLGDLNDLASASMKSLTGGLARAGRLDSGSFDAGAGDIAMSKFGKASEFFRDLPFKESEARFARMLPLLNLTAQFAGRPPVGQRQVGTQTGSGTTTATSDMFGPSFGRSFASNFGGFAGRGGLDGLFNSILGRGGVQDVPGGPPPVDIWKNWNTGALP